MNSWNGHANREHDVLERIVALLFALAGLAELAGSLPAPRRRLVLAILGRGEAAARAFLTGIASDTSFRQAAPSGEDAPELADVTAGDATLLAARLRALALMLVAMLARAALSERPGAGAGGREPARQACRQATSPAADTS